MECTGISQYEVIAICDRVQEYIQAKERQERLNPKPANGANSSIGKAGMKRLNMLLAQPSHAQQNSKSPLA